MTPTPEEPPTEHPSGNPPPLTVAASIVAVQGLVLLVVAVLELASIDADRRELGVSTTVFFAAYAVLLLVSAWALAQRRSWCRGPVLITQLILLGIAWNVREHLAVTIALVVTAGIALAGMLHPDTTEALDRDPTAPGAGQASDSSD